MSVTKFINEDELIFQVLWSIDSMPPEELITFIGMARDSGYEFVRSASNKLRQAHMARDLMAHDSWLLDELKDQVKFWNGEDYMKCAEYVMEHMSDDFWDWSDSEVMEHILEAVNSSKESETKEAGNENS